MWIVQKQQHIVIFSIILKSHGNNTHEINKLQLYAVLTY